MFYPRTVGFSLAPVIDSISVLIPTLGRPLLQGCFDAIAAGTRWPARLIVVDQSGATSVRDWTARLDDAGIATERLILPVRNRAFAVNRGLERVHTPFVAVIDDDCLVTPSWLEAIAGRLRKEPGAIVTGPVDPAGTEPVLSVRTSRKPLTQFQPSAFRPELLAGGNMGVALDTLARIGPLDEDPRLSAGEDREWGYRAIRAGAPIVYAPEVIVRHVGWRDAAQRTSRQLEYGRSLGVFYGKYVRRGDGLIAARALMHCAYSSRRLLVGWATRANQDRREARAFLTGMTSGILFGLRRQPSEGGRSPSTEVDDLRVTGSSRPA